MRSLGLVVAASIAGWLIAQPAEGASFLVRGGETVEGTIVAATRNTIVIRRTDGGMRQLPVGRLREVWITIADGTTLRGPFSGWRDGRTGIEVGSDVVWIERDRVVARAPLAGPAVAQGSPPAPVSQATPPAAPDARIAPEAAPSKAAQARVEAPLPPAPAAPAPAARPERATLPAPAARPERATLPAHDLPVITLKTEPDDVTRKTGEVVFTVELSRPLDGLLVVIYSTVDGSAHAGSDYAALQGILSLPPGKTRDEIRTAILGDGKPRGDKDFSLFLATNPDVARVAKQWTRVVIHDE